MPDTHTLPADALSFGVEDGEMVADVADSAGEVRTVALDPAPQLVAALAGWREAPLSGGRRIYGMGHDSGLFTLTMCGPVGAYGAFSTHIRAEDVRAIRDFCDGLLRDATLEG